MSDPQPPPPAPEGDCILPNDRVLLKLPSGVQKILRVAPDTTISLGKYGSFPANALIHRPYNLTFDVLDAPASGLRIVPAAEVNRDIAGAGAGGADESHYDLAYTAADSDSDAATEVMRTNRHTVDTSLSQTLSWQEIEALKASAATNSGRDLVTKLLASHTAIAQKTPFSLQKYTLRKTSKFLRRFSVVRLDVAALVEYLPAAKEPYRFLEMRNHHLALMMSLGNVCHGGRYLVVDETGGLLVSAVAERLGLLAPPFASAATDAAPERNTITLIHANEQPNLSHLSHFSYDANSPPTTHPLYSHLKTLTWLQLLSPSSDTTLLPPPTLPADELAALKTGKRSSHTRKHRRWARLIATLESTQRGGFDGLLVAAHMAVPGVLKALVPLVRGSGQVVVYTPALQQATEIADLYSSARRAAWILARTEPTTAAAVATKEPEAAAAQGVVKTEQEQAEAEAEADEADETPNPTLLLAPTVHKTATRAYQVLPGRTHPVMTSRGGAEGYVFHATRVIPVAGRVDARGAFGRKRKAEGGVEGEGEGGGKR
ncbi:Gcd10p family-domain-containing protein [Geopyxis carbonaria]|nr:Gcd10p family-domain-containing protein [Geopyxis carbonaria]